MARVVRARDAGRGRRAARARRARRSATTSLEPEAIPLEVVYQDADVLVIDKPAGLVTHPAPGPRSAARSSTRCSRWTPGRRRASARSAASGDPGIVHRLDRDTSGLLMVARNDAAQVALQAQLKARRVQQDVPGARRRGRSTAQVGRIETPIGRDPRDRLRMAVVADGKPAVTGYRVRERLRRLDAAGGGPRHRPHAPDPGAPRVDRPSGRRRPGVRDVAAHGADRTASSRLFLHAWRLEFVSPSSGRARAAARRRCPTSSIARPRTACGATDRDGSATDRCAPSRGVPGAQLVIISGPSGVGKDTIIEAMQRRPPRTPATTSSPARRAGAATSEIDGVSYHS